ncbi:MAG TPA: 2Fe-2S iron-sulfur cluster-binding protein [Lacipirellulaceae bacterium]|nr:2Fe-2S iron-sulfur cluster-binding protein [Lacipirellulaceae bacterium]
MDGIAQTIGLAFGWLLVCWVCLEGFVFSVGKLIARSRREREYERERAEFCRKIEATARAARAWHAIPDWNGWRPFRVAAVIDEAHDVKSFYFTPVDGKPLSPFAPGQYLTFQLGQGDGQRRLVRCYSLSDRPRQDYYRVTIKRIGPPPDHPDAPAGRGSSFFHESVHVGDTIEVRAPAGTFLIDPQADEPVVLLGAGIGVTPLVSMLEAIAHVDRPRDVIALFGFRSGADHPFKDRLTSLVEKHPNIRLHVSYSMPRDTDVLYRDYNHRGRVTIERVQQVLPSNNYQFYVCGPGALMESLVPALWEWGVPESHVHFEAFGPASVKRVGSCTGGMESITCDVRFERSNCTIVWDGSFASLLEFGEAAGVKMPSGCRAGSCGECMVSVRSGRVVQAKSPGIPVPIGQCLACISTPAESLVLDA